MARCHSMDYWISALLSAKTNGINTTRLGERQGVAMPSDLSRVRAEELLKTLSGDFETNIQVFSWR